jgi:uncharacterized OB-fold protein
MDTKPYMQDRAAEEFFSRLREGKFQSTRCTACGILHYPPHVICPSCLGDALVWEDLPRDGDLIAFTQQEGAIRCRKPDVLGMVLLEGVGNVFTRIDATFEELRIGQRVVFDTWESPDGIVLHQFRPI